MARRPTLNIPEPLADLPDSYLECRGLNHPWRTSAWYREGAETVVRISTCPRCDTERHDYWTRGGLRLANRYVYPDGYSIEGGVDREDVRVAVMARAVIHDNYEAALAAASRKRGSKR